MPNLETKIVCANSLTTYSSNRNVFSDDATQQLFDAHEEYYAYNLTADQKAKISDKIVNILHAAVPTFAQEVTGKSTKDESGNKALLREWFQHGTVSAPFFDADLFFPELRHHPGQGFDIVIGNPPYGGTDIPKELAQALRLGSRDPYGAFVARFLGDGQSYAPLRSGGVLAFIVSDTFMTIGSHLPLRQKLLHNYVHKMIRVHPDTFRATVNTVILVAERNLYDPKLPVEQKQIPAHHICQMVDLTNVSIHQQHDRFLELLHETEGFAPGQNKATSEYAVYYYPQQLIRTNSNSPFFVASPELYKITEDNVVGALKAWVTIGKKQVEVRKTNVNGQLLTLFKLGQIALVPQGISTGQNKYYVRRNEPGEGYLQVDYSKVLLAKDIAGFSDDEKLNGVSATKYDGRYFLPFDKGAESDTDEKFMPNYWVESQYYIDWSKKSLKRMRTLTIAERKKAEGKSSTIKDGDDKKIAAALRNAANWFKKSIVFSPTGQYSPTFRYGQATVGQNTSSAIICEEINREILMGILASKPCLYFFKNFYNHTVHTQESDLADFSIPLLGADTSQKVEGLVKSIAKNQKKNKLYEYYLHEQRDIDKIMYEAYGLNPADIIEVEAWHTRRYPKLALPENIGEAMISAEA